MFRIWKRIIFAGTGWAVEHSDPSPDGKKTEFTLVFSKTDFSRLAISVTRTESCSKGAWPNPKPHWIRIQSYGIRSQAHSFLLCPQPTCVVRVLPGLRDCAVVPDVAVVGKAVCHISRKSEMVLSSIEEVQ
jgi:hypothetical protein